MTEGSKISEIFSRNLWIIKHQVEGLTHEDSLLQLPFRGNCLNWVLGHLAGSRQSILEALGGESIMSKEARERYTRGSDPIEGDGKDILQLGEILDLLDRSQELIDERLENQTQEEFDALLFEKPNQQKVSEWVMFLAWHESYHTGQTEIFRQLTGRDDQVIK